MSETVLQRSIPYPARDLRPLPSLQVLDPRDWLLFDDAEEGQLRERRALVAERPGAVVGRVAGSEALEAECVAHVRAHLAKVHGRMVTATRLEDLAGLIQEDVVILEKRGGVHVMVAALLCFPASWMLSEKIGRPMAVIHEPVEEIGPRMDRVIERAFDAVRVERPLWRWNRLWYVDPALHQPRSAFDRREKPEGDARYFRSERQCLVRMPKTGGLIFSIHTYVVDRDDL